MLHIVKMKNENENRNCNISLHITLNLLGADRYVSLSLNENKNLLQISEQKL